jgi:hypothetical protein
MYVNEQGSSRENKEVAWRTNEPVGRPRKTSREVKAVPSRAWSHVKEALFFGKWKLNYFHVSQ